MQVWRNIKTQLRADMELVMQKREDRVKEVKPEEGGVFSKGRRTRHKQTQKQRLGCIFIDYGRWKKVGGTGYIKKGWVCV